MPITVQPRSSKRAATAAPTPELVPVTRASCFVRVGVTG